MDFKLVFTFTLVFIGCYAEISNELDVDDIKKQIGEHVPDLDLSGLDESKIPQADEINVISRKKCGNVTYNKKHESMEAYKECISNFVNVTGIREEIEKAKKTGSLGEVFGKYCSKYPEFVNCTNNFLEAIQPCLEKNENRFLNISFGLTHKLKDFICHKNGDRIAMFVAEGGVDCLQSQKEALIQCLNSTFAYRIPKSTPGVFPVLLFDAQDCSDFGKFRTCMAEALGHCKETTPANLMDAFFKYLIKIMPCTLEEQNAQNLKDSATSLATVPFLTLIIMFFMAKAL